MSRETRAKLLEWAPWENSDDNEEGHRQFNEAIDAHEKAIRIEELERIKNTIWWAAGGPHLSLNDYLHARLKELRS